MKPIIQAVFWAARAMHVASQFVPTPDTLTHTTGHMNIPVRYKEVPPSICETTPGVKTITGYVDVAENQHLFFWFFETRHGDPTKAPLTIWIDGGPGTPSTSGLFDEAGPCSVDIEGNLVYNAYSYNNVTNLLFIDQPVGTGFSYAKPVPGFVSPQGDLVQLPSDYCPVWVENQGSCGTWSNYNDVTTANSTIAAAPAYWMFLQGFTGAFPLYSTNGIHFATISYGGHYGPVFNAYILKQNALIANGSLSNNGAQSIDLRSVMIGNGWYDPIVGYEAYYNYTVNPGNPYGLRPLSKHAEAAMYNAMFGPGNCKDMLLQCRDTGRVDVCRDADNFCAVEVEFALDRAGRDEYDIREVQYAFPYFFYPDYLNQEHVLEAIGTFVKYREGSIIVTNTFADTGDDGRGEGTISDLRMLVSNGIYVVQYAGDADYICNWIGGEVIAKITGPPEYSKAGYVDINTPDGIVHGQVKQSNNFAFGRIYEAGHSVSFYQPLTALEILDRMISGKDIATGQRDVKLGGFYSTEGQARSTYQEGNATVVYHPLPLNATYNTTTNRPNPPFARNIHRRRYR